MAKDKQVEIEAVARFRHDGVYVEPGKHVLVSPQDAAELHAAGFAKKPDVPAYKDRAMRARSR